MALAVLSDVHGNLQALEAVLEDLGRQAVQRVLFLGDAVGYGAQPNECTAALARLSDASVAGNHDWAALGLLDTSYFNPYARAAIEWTARALSPATAQTLKALPLTRRLGQEDILLVHATPREPQQWHYLLSLGDAQVNFRHFGERICLLGHSHVPFIIEQPPGDEPLRLYRKEAALRKDCRYIINAGSVGQPRDGDPRACYLLLEPQRAVLKRVPYDIQTAQQRMRREGLPEPLIQRLSQGL